MGGIYWLASYPKSGNTWLRTVLMNFRANAEQPVDINGLSTGRIASNRIWVDDVCGFDTSDLRQEEIENLRPEIYRWTSAETETGFHKVHDAYRITASGRPLVDDIATRGAVYIIRNPLDVAPSFANHRGCSIDEAISHMADESYALARSDDALSDQLLQFMGSWSHHVLSWIEAANLKLMTLRYEDMHADPVAAFGQALAFLGLEADKARLERAIDFSRFDVLAAQEAESGFRERPPRAERFFRKGQVGDWRTSLDEDQVSRIIADHGAVMRRFGYLDAADRPL
jgi:hypothetical protein